MNLKILFIIVPVFVLLSLGYYFFALSPSQNRTKNAPLSTPFSAPSSPSLSFPVSLDQQGIVSANLLYQFRGKVINIQKVKQGTRINLDVSNLPEFIATEVTAVFEIKNGQTTRVTLEDIKVGSDILISMTYDLKRLRWDLNLITINPK